MWGVENNPYLVSRPAYLVPRYAIRNLSAGACPRRGYDTSATLAKEEATKEVVLGSFSVGGWLCAWILDD